MDLFLVSEILQKFWPFSEDKLRAYSRKPPVIMITSLPCRYRQSRLCRSAEVNYSYTPARANLAGNVYTRRLRERPTTHHGGTHRSVSTRTWQSGVYHFYTFFNINKIQQKWTAVATSRLKDHNRGHKFYQIKKDPNIKELLYWKNHSQINSINSVHKFSSYKWSSTMQKYLNQIRRPQTNKRNI